MMRLQARTNQIGPIHQRKRKYTAYALVRLDKLTKN